jgi:hypothetical protein
MSCMVQNSSWRRSVSSCGQKGHPELDSGSHETKEDPETSSG